MRRAVLQALVEAGSASRSIVVVRDLADGEHFLLDHGGARDVPENVPEELLERSRQALAGDGAQALEFDGRRYLIQTLSPPPRLVIIGAVHIAQKLIPMARLAGYDAMLVDPRASFASAERFPEVEIIGDWPQEVLPGLALDARTAVVTLSHDAKIDEPALRAALESDAFYIGALGSRKNHAKRLERLKGLGFDDATLDRIAGPVGLPLGGRSPAEIAIAILAQITQARYRRT